MKICVVARLDGDWSLLLISQRTKVGRLPDINEPVYVISRVVLLPLNQISVKDLDITVCWVKVALALRLFRYEKDEVLPNSKLVIKQTSGTKGLSISGTIRHVPNLVQSSNTGLDISNWHLTDLNMLTHIFYINNVLNIFIFDVLELWLIQL